MDGDSGREFRFSLPGGGGGSSGGGGGASAGDVGVRRCAIREFIGQTAVGENGVMMRGTSDGPRRVTWCVLEVDGEQIPPLAGDRIHDQGGGRTHAQSSMCTVC